ncbi:hypothetical protein HDU97_004865 [Phlyctochytrium planicorne]|nr:hypothetical protein HDU97_004865 [Phlyctochytrium planicorne]
MASQLRRGEVGFLSDLLIKVATAGDAALTSKTISSLEVACIRKGAIPLTKAMSHHCPTLGLTALHSAIRYNWPKCMMVLVESGADLRANHVTVREGWDEEGMEEVEGTNALAFCWSEGSILSYKRLLRHCVDRGVAQELQPALSDAHLEVFAGKLPSLGVLDIFKKEPHPSQEMSPTLLHLAAIQGHVDICRHLVESKVSKMKEIGPSGFTPLHMAAMCGQVDAVRYFIEADPKLVDIRSEDGLTPLQVAFKARLCELDQPNNMPVIRLLLEHGADPAAADSNNRSMFSAAAIGGSLEAFLHLEDVTKKAGIKWDPKTDEDSNLWSPGYLAARIGNLEVLKHLVKDLGVDPFAFDSGNVTTPFMIACAQGRLDLVKFMMEDVEGAATHVNDSNDEDTSALTLACDELKEDVVEYLCKHGADPNVSMEMDSETPQLFQACMAGSTRIVSALISAGAKICSVSDDIHPLDFAYGEGHAGVLEVLIRKIIDEGQKEQNGLTSERIAMAFEVALEERSRSLLMLVLEEFPESVDKAMEKEIADIVSR